MLLNLWRPICLLSKLEAVLGCPRMIGKVPICLGGQHESNIVHPDKQFHAAYAMLQATKPQTIGYGLNDSPAGTNIVSFDSLFNFLVNLAS